MQASLQIALFGCFAWLSRAGPPAASEGYINFNDAATSQCVGSCQSVVSGISLQTLAATGSKKVFEGHTVLCRTEANLTFLTVITVTAIYIQ